MVMTTPFLRALRARYPQAFLTLVVKRGIAPLFERCPYVDEVLTFDQRGPSLTRPFLLPLRGLRFAAKYLWKRRYALALLPRWDADYYYATFLAYVSGAPRRVGFSEKVIGRKREINRGFDRLLTDVVTDEAPRSEILHSLRLLEALGVTALDTTQELWLDSDDHAAAERLLETRTGDGAAARFIGIGPAGGHSVLKQWPLENFAALGRRLHEKYGAKILLFGGPDEQEMGRILAEQIGPPALSLVGKTSLRQTAALMERCLVYVGNDSGPTHMAAAAGVPVVAIFGSSCRHRFHPGGNTTLVWRELPCSPCQVSGHEDRCHSCIFDEPRCLTGISVEEVERAVIEKLAETHSAKETA